jgi:hypothetical protein
MDQFNPSDVSQVLTKLDEMNGKLSKLDSLDTKLAIHIVQSEEVNQCVKDMGKTLYGPNKDNGMVTKVNTLDVRQKIVYGILSTIGVSMLGLLIWLVQNAMSVATALAKAK